MQIIDLSLGSWGGSRPCGEPFERIVGMERVAEIVPITKAKTPIGTIGATVKNTDWDGRCDGIVSLRKVGQHKLRCGDIALFAVGGHQCLEHAVVDRLG